MLKISSLTLGLAYTNAYLIADSESKEAVAIDPAWDGHLILAEAAKNAWDIKQVWITHAHFDHFGGIAALLEGLDPQPSVALHPDDLPLWQAQGGAPIFGMRLDPVPEPTVELSHGQELKLGPYAFEVRFAPGHTIGHVMFYCASEGLLFSGDVVFQGSVGRTDLPGGDYNTLMNSIQTQVLTLPDETRVLSGHGPATTVGVERKTNPFLR
jgi:glyoxylase-like metal-dependent hydrolase (beta-lactamase superfamily II)